MQAKRLRTRRRLLHLAIVATAVGLIAGIPGSYGEDQATSPFSIDYHVISAGGTRLQGGCFTLNGTVAETAPGYSSGGIYSILAGFWPAANTDEIFANGFEGCGP